MHPLMAIAERHFSNMKEISTATVTLSEDVRKMCAQNKCGQYGKNWTCPPAVQPIDHFKRQIAAFNTFLVVYQVYEVKSSFDWKGMMVGGGNFKERLMALKKEVETQLPDQAFLLLGVGGCSLCDPCAYVTGEPCRNPQDALVSVEACGIDVMKMMKDNGLAYYNGKNTVTFIGGILYHKNFSAA